MSKQTEHSFYALLASSFSTSTKLNKSITSGGVLFVNIMWHIFFILNWIYIYSFTIPWKNRTLHFLQNEEDGEYLEFEIAIQ